MSKLFERESRADQEKLELLRKVQQGAEGREAIDAEAAAHIELLAETDAKLDRINARLDRFSSELNRWSQVQAEGSASRQRREPSASISEPRSSPLLTVCMLLAAGMIAGSAYTAWRQTAMPVDQQEGAPEMSGMAEHRTEPASMPALDLSAVPQEEPVAEEPVEATSTSGEAERQASEMAASQDTTPEEAVAAEEPEPSPRAPAREAVAAPATPSAFIQQPTHGRIRL